MDQYTVEEIYKAFKDMENNKPFVKSGLFKAGSNRKHCPSCEHHPVNFVTRKGGALYLECPECSLVFTQDAIDPEFFLNQEDYYFEQMTEPYALEQNIISTHIISKIKSDNKESPRLLEVGCGVGHTLSCFLAEGIDAIGVDISGKAKELCNKIYPDIGDRFIKKNFLVYSMEKKFDYIFLCYSLERFAFPEMMFGKLSKFLADEGKIFIITPNTHKWKRIDNAWKHINTFMSGESMVLYNCDVIERISRKHGLEMIRIEEITSNDAIMVTLGKKAKDNGTSTS
jgi:cyclopropane fatty-acyl-phospholipid synthase-like methyltransferase